MVFGPFATRFGRFSGIPSGRWSTGWMLVCLLLLPGPTLLARTLDIYFIDAEGGAATFIVTPLKESILIDTGWRREDGRDARRIEAVARAAGLDRITYLVTTHFHRDHYGGIGRLVQLIPVENFLDHGPMDKLKEDPQFPFYYTEYIRATRGNRQRVRPGDTIPLRSLQVPLKLLCVSAAGDTLEGEGPSNPACGKLTRKKKDTTDNARSVGLLLRYGDFEFLDLGDLTWNLESRLACPSNLLGQIDLYQTTHHGLANSNNPVLVSAVAPRVAVFNNGSRKGAAPEVFSLLKSLPSVDAIFQVHKNLDSGPGGNAPEDFIANLGGDENCAGHLLKVSVSADASTYTVTNGRNNLSRTYFTR